MSMGTLFLTSQEYIRTSRSKRRKPISGTGSLSGGLRDEAGFDLVDLFLGEA
jgi:hypothetical protein